MFNKLKEMHYFAKLLHTNICSHFLLQSSNIMHFVVADRCLCTSVYEIHEMFIPILVLASTAV